MRFAILCVIMLCFMCVVTDAFAISAATAGQSTLDDLFTAMTGNLGTMLGLGLSLLGLWVFLINQNSWGIMIVIAGITVTAFPGIFENIRGGVEVAITGATESTSRIPN